MPGEGSLQEDGKVKYLLVVSQEKYPGDIHDIRIIPWKIFLEMLGQESLAFKFNTYPG